MSNRIGLEQISHLYSVAKRFYDNEILLKDAVKLIESFEINKNSGLDYIYNLGHLLNGKLFIRTMNIISTEYYLDRISLDYGIDKLKNALLSLSLHIDYYESVSGAKVKSRTIILNRYLEKFDISLDQYYGDDGVNDEELFEGAVKIIKMNIYERNPLARKRCLDYYKAICQVCDFNFENKYGVIGRGFIHIHHLKEISEIKREYIIDFKNDLVPVCPNCHAMLHKRKPAYSIIELKQIIANNH